MGFYDKRAIERKEVALAGKQIPVAVGPRLRRGNFAANLFFGVKSLADGMILTLGTFLRPSRIVTRQYPENRETLKMYERFRARLTLVHDDRGYHLCTSCRACERACPNASISIEAAKGALTSKNELQHFVWRFDSCSFCNLCVFTCPFEALAMSPDFENAVYDRRLLVFCLNRYSGPHAALLDKLESESDRQKSIVPIGPYSGPLPLCGKILPGSPAHLEPCVSALARKSEKTK